MKFLAVFAVMLLASFCLYSQTALAPAEGWKTYIGLLPVMMWLAIPLRPFAGRAIICKQQISMLRKLWTGSMAKVGA